VILTCGKNSNGREFAPVAVRLTDDVIYEVAENFDVDAWRPEVSAPRKASVKPQVLREILEKGRQYDKKEIVTLLREETGVHKTRAYELVEQAVRHQLLRFE
jgi:hypothetical protein